MNIVEHWLTWMAGLGALVVIVANPNAVFTVAKAIQTLVGGTETAIITAKAGK